MDGDDEGADRLITNRLIGKRQMRTGGCLTEDIVQKWTEHNRRDAGIGPDPKERIARNRAMGSFDARAGGDEVVGRSGRGHIRSR